MGALLLAGIVCAIWASLLGVLDPREKTPTITSRLRDVYADSPYLNARPGIGYVGDAACAGCHQEISEAYHLHPMGRSLAPVAGAKDGPPANAATGIPIDNKGVQYTIEHRDGKVFHKATRRDVGGNVLAEIGAEVRFALGSGTRGISYLIDRDGYLFQSPISWYTQQQRWDISPDYGAYTKQANFERPVQPNCLFCHANQFHSIAGTENHYETPIFQGLAIGCERCHGPGDLHVSRDHNSTEFDATIVNPARLAPALRDSVCEQCHLQGTIRIARAGHEPWDYRPGLPIHRFLAVFLMKYDKRDRFDAVGHVEQMATSRCFTASEGQLGCISCHDPHRLPAPATKVAYYRERCLECHVKNGCALPLAERQARGKAENCIACHMPRSDIANVPHTAATDHRILRGVPGSVPGNLQKSQGQPGESHLMDFHWPLMTEEEQQDAARDMGVALGWAARSLRASPQVAKLVATQGLPLLEAAVRDRPDDLSAREFLGETLAILDRPEDALHAFEEVLRREPGRESALHSSGRLLTHLQRLDLALGVAKSDRH